MTRSQLQIRKIYDASLQLFSSVGYSRTSLKRIAEQAGLSESNLAVHFKTKKEVFNSMVEHFKLQSIGKNFLANDIESDFDEPDAFLISYTTRMIKQWNSANEKKFFRTIINTGSSGETAFPILISDMRALWWMLFDEMIQSGLIRPGNPVVFANSFIYPLMMIRLEFQSEIASDRLNEALRAGREHVDFFLESVAL